MKIIPVTAALIRDGEMLLVAQRKRVKFLGGMWEFPGGKIEPGETAEECIARELREEFGVKITAERFAADLYYDYGSLHVHLIAYWSRYEGGSFELRDHEQIEWLRHEEIERFELVPADKLLCMCLF
jgi:8-oxo-dGTP diphosphatase